jgi:hypothetical protein
MKVLTNYRPDFLLWKSNLEATKTNEEVRGDAISIRISNNSAQRLW